jgi:lactoylglutathione lyase
MIQTSRITVLMIVAFLLSHSITAQKFSPSLNHVALYVSDLKKSTAFYHDIVQLDTVPEPFHDGIHTWFSIGPGCCLHIIQGAAANMVHDKHSHLCFTVSSLKDFILMLDKNNIDYESWTGEKKGVTLRPDKVKQIYFTDPDGYWIEVNDAKN